MWRSSAFLDSVYHILQDTSLIFELPSIYILKHLVLCDRKVLINTFLGKVLNFSEPEFPYLSHGSIHMMPWNSLRDEARALELKLSYLFIHPAIPNITFVSMWPSHFQKTHVCLLESSKWWFGEDQPSKSSLSESGSFHLLDFQNFGWPQESECFFKKESWICSVVV